MLICEKGAVKALGEAFKKGYEISPSVGGNITICTSWWALETNTRELPLKVSQLLVEHYGGIPCDPAYVQAGKTPQSMMELGTAMRECELRDKTDADRHMLKIPVIFRENWQLFVTGEGKVIAFDLRFLDMLDWRASGSIRMHVSDTGVGLFALGNERLTIAPCKFGAEDMKKLSKIAELYKDQRVELVEAPENLCMFDDIEE